MRPPILVIVVVLLVGISAALSASNLEDRDAVAAGNWRLIVPNLARDAALPAPTATPAPTYDPERWVNIQLSITAHELAVAETGLMDIHIGGVNQRKDPHRPGSPCLRHRLGYHNVPRRGLCWLHLDPDNHQARPENDGLSLGRSVGPLGDRRAGMVLHGAVPW